MRYFLAVRKERNNGGEEKYERRTREIGLRQLLT